MKKIFDKKIIYGVIIGGVLFGSIGVLAANYLYKSEDVLYDSDKTDKTNVKEALDGLFELINEKKVSQNFRMIITASISVGSGCEDDVGANNVTMEITYIDGVLSYPNIRQSGSWVSSCGSWRVGYFKIINIEVEYI